LPTPSIGLALPRLKIPGAAQASSFPSGGLSNYTVVRKIKTIQSNHQLIVLHRVKVGQ